MQEILTKAWAELSRSSPLEQFATVLGVIGVWLMMRQNLWTFPISLVQVAIFGWVCFTGRLYSETALQVIFFFALIYGWILWTRRDGEGGKKDELPVHWLDWPTRCGWLIATLALWGVWGYIMVQMKAALPWPDAFVFSTSVAAQVLQSRKAMENWLGWVISNTASVWVFWRKEYYWFMVFTVILWFMSWGGWREWSRAMKKQISHV